MKVVLKEDVDLLGLVGDIVTVKNGYARNYLIPKGLAIQATEKNLKIFDERRKVKAIRADYRVRHRCRIRIVPLIAGFPYFF